MKINEWNNEFDTKINDISLSVEVNNLIEDIQNRTIALVKINWIWNIWKELRDEWEFEKAQIDADWAIKDVNLLLEEYRYDIQNQYFLNKFSKLALWNTCSNVWNDWFELYTKFLNKLWVEISSEELKKIAWNKIETQIWPNPYHFYA